jgi:hypothetical protein
VKPEALSGIFALALLGTVLCSNAKLMSSSTLSGGGVMF